LFEAGAVYEEGYNWEYGDNSGGKPNGSAAALGWKPSVYSTGVFEASSRRNSS